MRRVRHLSLLGAALMIAGPLAMAADASTEIYGVIPVDAQASVSVTSKNCTTDSSEIEVNTSVRFGIGAGKLTMKNNLKGTKELQVVGDAVIEFSADAAVLPVTKSVAQSGVGGNPWIYAKLPKRVSRGGEVEYTDPVLVGRCVTGNSWTHRQDIRFEVDTSTLITILECNARGRMLNMGNSHKRAGASGELRLTHKRGTAWAEMTGVVVDGQVGSGFKLADPYAGGIEKGADGPGGNPLLFFQHGRKNLTTGVFEATDSELALGRCNKLQ